ncbi:MAG: LytR C-terminal domain-containing protein [Pleurocapsa sp.]
MSIANFLKKLESDDIQVNLVSGYIAGEEIRLNNQRKTPQSTFVDPILIDPQFSDRSFKIRPVAVQNTTGSPELGMDFINYLRDKNFQDVYLVEHIPLKLDKTQIIVDQSQLARAKHLKNIIGFGKLEPKSYSQQPLTIQIGEDARYLLLENPNY